MFNIKPNGKRNYIEAVLLLSLTVGIAACDLPQMASQKSIEKETNDEAKKLGPKVNEAAGIGVQNPEMDPLAISNEVWLGNEAVRMRSGKPLPAKFENTKGFTMISAAPVDLRTVATQVANSTGIKTNIGDLFLPSDTGHATTTATSTTTTPTSTDTTSTTERVPLLPSLVQTSTDSINVSYSGPLSKFLDQISAQLDVSWRYDGESIYFYRYESRTFSIEALATKSSLSDSFSPSQSSSSGGSSSSSGSSSQDVTQSNSFKSDLDAWKDIEAALKGILGNDGAEVMVPSDGTVVVTARPAKLDQISKYIREENNRMTRQVAIDVVVYNVDVTNEDNYGLDLSGAFKLGGGSKAIAPSVGPTTTTTTTTGNTTTVSSSQTTITGLTAPTGVSGTTTLTSPASTVAEGAGSLAIGFLGSHWNASAIAQALSTLGPTVEVTRAPIVTLNNRAASRKIATDQTYIASQSATAATSTSAATQSITPGVATTGITLQVLPRLTTNNQILVQYSIMISALNGTITQTCASPGTNADNPTAGGSSCIGTPNITSKVFVQQALLQNGSTLVLAGFDDENDNDSLQGIGSPYNWLMGSTDAKKDHQHLVITMTPREITPDRGNS